MKDKIKKTMIAASTAAMLMGNAHAVEFKVKNAPSVEPTRIEQILPDAVQEFQSEYDATEALQLLNDIVQNPLFNDDGTAGMEKIQKEIVDYLKRAKENSSDLAAAYQDYFTKKNNQEIPAAISKTLSNEITVEEVKKDRFTTETRFANKYHVCTERGILNELAVSVKDKSAKLHPNAENNPYSDLTSLEHNVGTWYPRVSVSMIEKCAKHLSSEYGDYNLCVGLLTENINTEMLRKLFEHCYELGIDVRPFIEEANQVNEKAQEPMGPEMGM